jgi:hypothetical protein
MTMHSRWTRVVTRFLLATIGAVGMLAAGGCAGDDLQEIDPRELPTGIYALHVTTFGDSCSPHLVDGDFGEMAIATDPRGGVAVTMPRGSRGLSPVIERHSLVAESGYQAAWSNDVGAQCGGEVVEHRDLTLAATTTAFFTVRERTQWTVLAACASPGWDDVPTANCQADQEQRYDLIRICEAPCTLRQDGDRPTCACP